MPGPIDDVVADTGRELDVLQRDGDTARHFLCTYRRATVAVGAAGRAGRVEDPEWLGRWDVAFAELYLQALAADRRCPRSAPGPWREAFAAPADLHPYLRVLLGMNAHINYDMPQSLLGVITDPESRDPAVLAAALARLEDLVTGRVQDLLRPRHPLLHLARRGFGVRLAA